MSIQAQDPLWAIGSSTIGFPGEPGASVHRGGLKQSHDPDIPDAYEYQGQVAERTQNVQYDDEGRVMFFIVDGKIYNGDGLLIADDAANIDDRDCEVCFLGGEEVHIVPFPGSCTKFFVFGLFFDSFQREAQWTDEGMLRWGVLDMGLRNDLPVYAEHCTPVNGRFMTIYERIVANIHLLGSTWLVNEILPTNAPEDAFGYLQDGTIYTSTEGEEVIYGASVQVDGAGRQVMVVRVNQGLLLLQIDATGITRLSAPYLGNRWPNAISNDNTVADFNFSQRGEIALNLQGSTLKVAHSSYDTYPTGPPINNTVHQTRVNFWTFNLTLGSTIGVTANITAATAPNPNPRTYSLDLYSISQTPLDFAGNPITRPAVSGLEFSPNGRYIYFVKSPSYAFPNSGGVESNFGYIDLNWSPGSPGTHYTFLPIDDPLETRKLADTQMGINVGPDGTGTALYVLGADAVGEYWLGAFRDPDNPDPSNWTNQVVELGNVSFRTETNSPLTQFRHVNRRAVGSTHYTTLGTEVCREELLLARDRSGTIDPELCDLTWEPGDNAFWDSADPIYVATELRIAAGAHVLASNMVFRFGEDAVLTVEPGASFQCTNCILTNACPNKRWGGIEVHGTASQHQFGTGYPTHQGRLDLFASVVENAYIGVLASARFDLLNSTGGVVNCAAATVMEDTDGDGYDEPVWKRTIFRNCREGVKFYPYQNFNTNSGSMLQNLSRFTDVHFTVAPQDEMDYNFLYHANLWKVDGIHFTGCIFDNTFQDAAFGSVGSAGLGHGIYSLDANYRVNSNCEVPWPSGGLPCPETLTRRCTFTGLDHGIHALQATTLRNFTVDRAQFTNNICGVYVEGVVGYKVVNSNFSVGGRNVALTNFEEIPFVNRHRGIFSTQSYGMVVEDNEVDLDPASAQGRLAEGIVIGFSGDHNDVIFRNTVRNMERGYVGEGVCMDQSNRATVGLQFWCNTNASNDVDIRSRILTGTTAPPADQQSIRLQQGTHGRVADNEFDQDANGYDFYNDGFQYNLIGYYWAQPAMPYWPEYVSQGVARDEFNTAGQPHVRRSDNCASRRLPLVDYPYPARRDALHGMVVNQKLAYANTRWLYDALIDGGNTDQVLLEIMGSWPQDAWELRSYLLAKSPYLSVEVLEKAAGSPSFPEAMKAEVCVANPEATKTEGFLKWLEFECPYPLSESMIESIRASWEVRTYRTTLEENLADHHAEMSQAANLLLEYHGMDEENDPTAELRGVWQEVRTAGARYAEALSLVQEGEYVAALQTVGTIPQEHPKLREKQVSEKQRMEALITFLQGVAADGRGGSELTEQEQDQLEAIVNEAHDRPATWAQNLLCYHYGRCRAPLTGGDDEKPKSLTVEPTHARRTGVSKAMSVQPNPSTTWAAVNFDVAQSVQSCWLLVLDGTGRLLERVRLAGGKGQHLLDTRAWAPGTYTVELQANEAIVGNEKLVVLP